MKKWFSTLALLVTLVLLAVPMETRAAELVHSDYCGADARYKLYNDGTVVISGTGSVDFRDTWHYAAMEYGIDVTTLRVEEGITYLPAGIQAYDTLRSAYLPSTLESLNSGLFEDHTKLNYVSISEGTTYIGRNAFAGCTSLTSVWLPGSVTEVQSGAFADCWALKRVTMPAALEVGSDVFEGCDNLKELNVDDLAAWITSKRTVDYWRSINLLWNGMDLYVKGELVTELVIPEGTTEIGTAFSGCTSLTKVTVPGSVKRLVDSFYGCTALEEVILEEGVQILSAAFSGCTALEKITVPSSVIAMEDFNNCPNLTKIVMHHSADNVWGFNLDHGNVATTLICTGDPFDNIYGFEGRNLSVYYPADNDKWDAADGWWKDIPNMPFRYMDGCGEATSGGKHIAFTDEITCTRPAAWTCALCEQDLGTTEAIGHTIVIQEGSAAICTNGGSTNGKYCSVCKEVLVPQVSVGDLGHLFTQGRDCYRCGEVLREGTKIDGGLCGSNVRWDFYSNGRLILSGEGAMYDYSRKEAPYAEYRYDIRELIICEGVTAISYGAFRGCGLLSEVSIANTVAYIGDTAFAETGLWGVTIPDSVTYLGSAAFYDCNQLRGVTLSGQLQELRGSTFVGCENLTSIIIPGSVRTLADEVCGIEMETVILNGTERFTEDKLKDAFSNADFYWLPADVHTHTFGDWEIIAEATCETKGTKLRICTCGETLTEDIPALDHNYVDYQCIRCGKPDPDAPHVHSFSDWTVTTTASCESAGTRERVCGCGEKQTETIPMLEHKFQEGSCTRCGEKDPDYAKPTEPTEPEPIEPTVIRVADGNRIGTSLAAADQLKKVLGVSKFDAVVVANAMDFPDALSGSYLAATLKAPILLYADGQDSVIRYIYANLEDTGNVYILGGQKSVSEQLTEGLDAFDCHRISGSGRFGTSLAIIAKADAIRGRKPDKVLICDGTGFADSLSASATGLPILLVNGKSGTLREDQKAYLESIRGAELYVIGGKNTVSDDLLKALDAYDANGAERISGSGRELTSVEVARKFFPGAKTAALASSLSFPDGLSGGPVAYAVGGPLLLTREGKEAAANAYVQEKGILSGYVIGGSGSISDATANAVFTTK
ncbi:MAG: leucine-rich repeat protein [Oscillospiraceae bacterium]|nr:leucine-rich repeat protein [Oscillospiraceae bacterium]